MIGAKKRLISKIRLLINYLRVYNKPKVFGIGANKTGTTSLKIAMQNMGYIVGNQNEGEKLLYDWGKRDFESIIKYCYSAQFFQDIPFSLPYTYISLDRKFPNSKFILTIRNNSEEWYNSFIQYHSLKWGSETEVPKVTALKESSYNSTGWIWDTLDIACNVSENDPYNKEHLIHFYETHNRMVREYFRHRPQDILILNPSEPNAMKKLCDFLGEDYSGKIFPKENVTENLIY